MLGEMPNQCNSPLALSLILLHTACGYSRGSMKPGEDVIRESRMRGSLKGGYG